MKISEAEVNALSQIRDFNSLDKLKDVFRAQFQEKHDFELYIAPVSEELKSKFERAFLEAEEPYEKLFDGTFLREAFPKACFSMPLTLYVYLGEEKETGLFGQTLGEFADKFRD